MKKYLILLFANLILSYAFAQIQVGNTTLTEREVIGGLDVPWEIKWGPETTFGSPNVLELSVE